MVRPGASHRVYQFQPDLSDAQPSTPITNVNVAYVSSVLKVGGETPLNFVMGTAGACRAKALQRRTAYAMLDDGRTWCGPLQARRHWKTLSCRGCKAWWPPATPSTNGCLCTRTRAQARGVVGRWRHTNKIVLCRPCLLPSCHTGASRSTQRAIRRRTWRACSGAS